MITLLLRLLSCSNNNINCAMKCVYSLFPQTPNSQKKKKRTTLLPPWRKKLKREWGVREKPAKYTGCLASNQLLLHTFQTHFLYKKLYKQCQYRFAVSLHLHLTLLCSDKKFPKLSLGPSAAYILSYSQTVCLSFNIFLYIYFFNLYIFTWI